MFKKATGISFIDYLSRVRVEKSKTLLLNPNSRISETAFASGFQSMTNFNRAFKRIVGRSPTQFRKSLPKLRRSVEGPMAQVKASVATLSPFEGFVDY